MGERGPHGQLCWAAVSSPFPVSEPTGDEPSAPDVAAPVSPEDAQRLTERTRDAIALLQAIQERRGLLAHIDLELRTELMRVAGQVARPSPYEKRELARAASACAARSSALPTSTRCRRPASARSAARRCS